MRKKLISGIVALLWLVAVLPVMASSAANGSCGNDIEWSLENGRLSISGSGAMIEINIPTLCESTVTEVVIEDGISEICNYAFDGFENLKKAVIPDSVKSIGAYAFWNCSALNDVQLPPNLEKLGTGAFGGCAMDSITIPETLEEIGGSAFKDCDNITSVYIPNNVTSIEGYAFCGCTAIKTITVGENVTTIGDYAFADCTALETLYWNSARTEDLDSNNYVFKKAGDESQGVQVFFDDEVSRIPSYLFYPHMNMVEGRVDVSGWTPHITNISLPHGLKTIGEYAFFGSIYLTDITIPESTISIEESAFEHSALEKANIPKNVSSIGREAFVRCDSLTQITVDENNGSYSAVDGVLFDKAQTVLIQYPAGKADLNYLIPDTVEVIGTSAFSGNDILAGVTIPESVKIINGGAFSKCTALEAVYIPDNVEKLEGSLHFWQCYGLKEARLPGSITAIPWGIFNECKALSSVNIPDKVRIIGSSAFGNCSFTSIEIPDSVTEIGSGAFGGCDLTEIELPENLETIGSSAFNHCTNLTSVEIPDKVISIGDSAFNLCMNLVDITLPVSVETIGKNVFTNTNLKVVLYKGSNEQWQKIEKGSDKVLAGAKKYYNYDGRPMITFAEFSDSEITAHLINCEKITNATIILAIYDENGKFLKLISKPSTEGLSFISSFLKKGTAKLMLWNSLLKPIPITESLSQDFDFTGGDYAEEEVIGGSGGDAGGNAGGTVGEIIGGVVAG